MWDQNPGTSTEATLLPTNLASGDLFLWPPQALRPFPGQEKVWLLKIKSPYLWAKSQSSPCTLGYLLGTWRCFRTTPSHEGRSRRKQRFPPSGQDLTPCPLQRFLLRNDVLTCFQVPPTEQGLRKSTQLAANYSHGYLIWFGPITPMIVFCHPDMLRSIANASGTHAELVVVGVMTHLMDFSPSLPTFYVAPTGPCSPFLSSLSATSSLLHAFIKLHLTDSCFFPWPFGLQPCTLLKFIPNLKVSYLDREILDLVRLVRNWPTEDVAIRRRNKILCWGVLEGFLEEEVLELGLEQ